MNILSAPLKTPEGLGGSWGWVLCLPVQLLLTLRDSGGCTLPVMSSDRKGPSRNSCTVWLVLTCPGSQAVPNVTLQTHLHTFGVVLPRVWSSLSTSSTEKQVKWTLSKVRLWYSQSWDILTTWTLYLCSISWSKELNIGYTIWLTLDFPINPWDAALDFSAKSCSLGHHWLAPWRKGSHHFWGVSLRYIFFSDRTELMTNNELCPSDRAEA